MIHCFDKASEIFLKVLQSHYSNIISQIHKKLPKAELLIFDNSTGAYEYNSLRKDTSRELYCIFRKDDLIFFGPFITSENDICPYCILLHLSVEKEMLTAIKSSSKPFRIRKKIDFELTSIKDYTYSVNTLTGHIIPLKNPLKHPGCRHIGEYNGKPNNVHQKISLSKLFERLYDEKTGIIRQVTSIKSIASPKIARGMGNYEVYVSRFENPFFYLYPDVGFLDTSVGSGTNYSEAMTKMVYETVERYSSLIVPMDSPDKIGKFSDLPQNAISPELFWHYSLEQRAGEEFPFKNMTNKSKLKWRRATNLIGGEVFLPEDYLYINMVNPSPYINNTTSGCAAHSDFYSACLNALLELVERDNTMRHWLAGLPAPHVAIPSLSNKIKKEISSIDTFGYDVRIINCSRYKSIYTFIVLLSNNRDIRPAVITSSASSIDPEEAILKAFNEAKGGLFVSLVLEETTRIRPIRLKFLSDPRDHANYYRSPMNKDKLKHYLQSAKQEHLNLQKTRLKRKDDLIIKDLLTELRNEGIDVYFKDLTFEPFRDLGIYVVRAISPQLVPLVFGTGMLPVEHNKLGRISYTHDSLNFPHPFS